jgi:peptidoglycan-associated lipoprotein
MRRILLAALSVSAAITLAGCPPKVKRGECKSSADCAKQEGVGKICVDGRCEECGQDSDCKAGFVCRDHRCAPKPQCGPDAPCPAGQECVAERCVAARQEQAPSEQDAAAAGRVPPECADPSAFTIRFDFDRYTITAQSQGTLQKLAECLKRAPAKGLTANGFADERGTAQYNVALSAKRAEAAKKYLGDLGVQSSIQTVGNGEEGALCTDTNEGCWSKNRRVEFQVAR